jgi:hypothetical protein
MIYFALPLAGAAVTAKILKSPVVLLKAFPSDKYDAALSRTIDNPFWTADSTVELPVAVAVYPLMLLSIQVLITVPEEYVNTDESAPSSHNWHVGMILGSKSHTDFWGRFINDAIVYLE